MQPRQPQLGRRKGWLLPLHGLLTVILVLYIVSGLIGIIATLGDYFLGGHPLHEILDKSPLTVQASTWEVYSMDLAITNKLNAVLRDLPHDPAIWVPSMDLTLEAQISHPTALQWILKYLTFYPTSIAILPMLIVGRRLIRAAYNHDPFTVAIIQRIRKLGLVVLTCGAGAELIECVSWIVLRRMVLPHSDPVPAMHDFSTVTLWWLLPGLIILAFGEILQRGGDMRAELDEVI